MSDFQFAILVVAGTVLACASLTKLAPQAFRLRDVALPGVLLWSFTTFVLLGAPWVYVHHTGGVRDTYLALLSLGLISTVLGVVCTSRALGPVVRHVEGPARFVPPSASWLVPIASAGAIALLGLYILVVPEIPLLSLIRGSATGAELDAARENALKLLPGQAKYIFSITRSVVFPFLSIVTYIEARRRRRLAWWGLFLATFGCGLFFAAATLEKSSVGALFITLYLGALFGKGGQLGPRRIMALGTLGIAFPIFVTSGSTGFDPGRTGDVLLALGRRIFYLPSEVIYRYVEYTSDRSVLLMGRTIPYVSKFLPGGPVPIDNVIYIRYFQSGNVTSGSANAGYLGQLWVDFGWYGATVGAFLVGVALTLLHRVVLTVPRTAPSVALRAIVTYQVVGLSSTGFTSMLDPLGPGIVWFVGLSFVALGLASSHRRRTMRSVPSSLSTT